MGLLVVCTVGTVKAALGKQDDAARLQLVLHAELVFQLLGHGLQKKNFDPLRG